MSDLDTTNAVEADARKFDFSEVHLRNPEGKAFVVMDGNRLIGHLGAVSGHSEGPPPPGPAGPDRTSPRPKHSGRSRTTPLPSAVGRARPPGAARFTGAAAWPGLGVSSRPGGIPQARGILNGAPPVVARQVLVGDFAPPDDCDDYLAARQEPAHPGARPRHDHGPVPRPAAPPRPRRHAVPGTAPHRPPPSWPTSSTTFPPSSPGPCPTSPPTNATCCAPSAPWTPSTPTSRPVPPGLTHRAAADRLIQRPFISENPFGLWPEGFLLGPVHDPGWGIAPTRRDPEWDVAGDPGWDD